MKGSQRSSAWPILLLVLVCGSVFSYTVRIREPWFGVLSPSHHQWLTAETLIFARNWSEEGAWKLRFALLENPDSIEFETLESRGVYCSFPQGSVVPIHLISKALGRPPTPAMVMGYNLANHFLIALLLGLTVLFFLRSLGLHPLDVFLLSLVPMGLELLLPGPLYMHQNVYCHEPAVLLPFAAALFLEVLREGGWRPGTQKWLGILQWGVFFYGMSTDWLFVMVSLVFYLKRVLVGEISRREPRAFLRESLVFGSAPGLALGLFAWHLAAFDNFGCLLRRFMDRTGIDDSQALDRITGDFEDKYWGEYVTSLFGRPLLWALLIGSLVLVVLAVRARRRPGVPGRDLALRALTFGALALLPALFHAYSLLNFAFVHDFVALNLSLAFAVIPLVLAPLSLWASLSRGRIGDRPALSGTGGWSAKVPVLSAGLLSLCGLALWAEHPGYRSHFPRTDPRMIEICGFVRDHRSLRDVVFSPQFSVPKTPPVPLAYSGKRVYPIRGWEEVRQMMRHLPKEARAAILVEGTGGPIPLRTLEKLAVGVARRGDLALYWIPSQRFTGK